MGTRGNACGTMGCLQRWSCRSEPGTSWWIDVSCTMDIERQWMLAALELAIWRRAHRWSTSWMPASLEWAIWSQAHRWNIFSGNKNV